MISLVKKDGLNVSFVMKGTSVTTINTLRRLILNEVPTLAVDVVEMKDNSSALYDEVIAHRLGFIPIRTDLTSYRMKAGPEDEGNAACELKIALKSNKKGVVTASQAESADPKCTFVYEDMPITKLLPKQRIEFIATAVLGRGKNHSKWSPGHLYYHEEQSKRSDAKKSSDAYVVNVESWGQLTCEEMLRTACEIIIQKCDAFETAFGDAQVGVPERSNGLG